MRPVGQVIPFRSELDSGDARRGAEMLQTAHGSLTVGLDLQAVKQLLIRGGTSWSVWPRRCSRRTVGATYSRPRVAPSERPSWRHRRSDHVSSMTARSRRRGGPSLPNAGRCGARAAAPTRGPIPARKPRYTGVVCFTGILSNEGSSSASTDRVHPDGVRLTARLRGLRLPQAVLQDFITPSPPVACACRCTGVWLGPSTDRDRRMRTWRPANAIGKLV